MKGAFSKLLQVLRNPWVFTFLAVTLLALLFWFTAPLIGAEDDPPLGGVAIRLAIIAGMVALWLIAMLVFQLTRKDKPDEADEAKAEDDARRRAEEALRSTRNGLVQQFTRQMEVLRDHLPGKRSGRYAYHLPWYLVLGMKAAGKSTLLVSSGQEYPLAHLLDTDPLAPVAPTTGLPCWVTNEAVFIDTPGSLFAAENSETETDRLQWDTLIQLLTEYRGRRPVNGVVMVISIEDLITKSDHERAVDAQIMRRRVLELIERLGTRFPIYVVLSKADMLAGFVEFFDDLHRQDRDQVWGISFPIQGARLAPGEREVWREVFSREFGRLVERLNQRLLRRVHEERDPRRRALVYGFPQRLGGIQRILDATLTQIFAVDRYTTPPLLRGIYLTSSLQSGVPHDPLMGAVALSFDVERAPLPALRSSVPFFTRQVLGEIVLPEAGLASDNMRVERRKIAVSTLVYASCAAAIAGCAWAGWSRHETSVETLAGLRAKVDIHSSVAAQARPAVEDAARGLDPLREARENMKASSGWLVSPVSFTNGEELIPLSGRAYQAALHREFPTRLANQLAGHLRDTMDKSNPEVLLHGLRVYLMLGQPERLEPEVMRSYMAQMWAARHPDSAALRRSLATHLDEWMAGNRQGVQTDDRLIGQIRRILSRTPRAQRIYSALRSDGVAKLPGGIEISRSVGPDFSRVFVYKPKGRSPKNGEGSISFVPRFFTTDGWKEFVHPNATSMSEASLSDSWVTGDFGGATLDDKQFREFQRAIGEHYMQDYIATWRTVLNGVDIVQFQSIDQAVEFLELVSGPGSPLLSLLNLVSSETTLPIPEPAATPTKDGALKLPGKAGKVQKAAGKAADVVGTLMGKEEEAPPPPPGHLDAIPTLSSYFAQIKGLTKAEGGGPSYMDNVGKALADVHSFTRQIVESPAPDVAAFEVVRARATGKGDNPIVRLRILANSAPAPVQGWLRAIADRTWAEIVFFARVHLDNLWSAEIYGPWTDKLAGRFPLDPSSSKDASIQDVAEFLGPKGRLETFYAANLQPFIDPQSGRPRNIDGMRVEISDHTLAQIRQARVLRDALFPGGGTSPSVNFTLQPARLDPSVAHAILEIDNQHISYRHGPAAISRVVWPATDGSAHAELRFQEVGPYGRILRETASGPWSWFRLLQKAAFEDNGASRRLTFTMSGRAMSFDVWIDRQVNPFALGNLPRLHLAPEL